MRILIATGIFPPDVGGPATYVSLIAGEFVKRGHRVTVVALSDSLEHDDSVYPFEVIRVPRRIPKFLRLLTTPAKIISAGRQIDVLYENAMGLEAVLANFALRKPMVQKVVGDRAWERARNKSWIDDDFLTFQTKKYSLKVKLMKWLRAWWTRQADYIIVTTHCFKEVVSGWLDDDQKIRVIGNASAGRSPGRKSVDIPLQTKQKVVTVCRLVNFKAIDDLIYAISYLDDVGLVVIGEGPERSNLERLSGQLGLNHRIFFAGRVANEDVPAYLQACDIFVLPSIWESFGIVILEAMAVSIPVIASDTGGLREIIQHERNGLLFPPGDKQALSEAISALLKNDALRKELVKASQATLTEFSVDSMVEKTLQVLNGAVVSR